LRQAADEATQDGTVAGLVLVAANAAGTRQACVAGHAALLPQPEAMTFDTLFDLASLTKVLSTTLVALRLCDRGQLDLDEPLSAAAPGRYPADKGALTPRLLLTHTAGLPPFVPFQRQFAPASPDPARVREEVLARIRHVPLATRPNAAMVYSDLGLVLLGDLIESRTGIRLDRLFAAEVAAPLGLRNTFYIHGLSPLPEAVRPPTAFAATENCAWRRVVVRGQVHDENAFLLLGVAGHAGLFGTASDVMTVAEELLRALTQRSPLLSRSAAEAMTTPQPGVGGSPRGLGWALNTPGSSCGRRFTTRAFGHTGFTGTSCWIDPELGACVVLLANRVHPTRDNERFLAWRPGCHDLTMEALGPF
jgi:CubicO group peptidase (beta-lactamase class C family)